MRTFREQVARLTLEYALVFSTLRDGILRVGADGRIAMVNPAATRLLGRTMEDLQGQRLHPVLHGAWVAEESCSFCKAVDAGQPAEVKEALALRDGTSIFVDCVALPLWRGDGPRSGAVVVVSEALKNEHSARLAALVESSSDAIVSKDLDGVIKTWNKSAERIFGYSAEEAIGKSITMIIPPELRGEEERILARIRAGQTIQHYDTKRRRKDGQLLDISLTISPIKDSSGRVIGASKIARDITERKQAEQELEATKRRLEELGRMKNQFINVVAHELRNPMTPILMQLQMLRMSQLTASQMRSVDVLDRSMGRLNALVEQLLDVARLESGRLPFRIAEADLAEVVREAVEMHAPVAEDRGVRIDFGPAGPLKVEADAQRLMQVMVNLLANAVKFTPQGGRVLVKAASVDGEAVVSVQDTGLGFTPAQGQQLFQAFSQLHSGVHGGSGLGLYISRSIVEAHGGRMFAESPGPNAGATFGFALPLAGHARGQTPQQSLAGVSA